MLRDTTALSVANPMWIGDNNTGQTYRAARGDRSQYRLQIDTATDGDGVTDTAVFAKDTFLLGRCT